MKKIFAVVVGLSMLLLPGISVSSSGSVTAVGQGITKQKTVTDVKASQSKKTVIRKAKSLKKGFYISGQLGITLLPDLDDVPKVTLEFEPGYSIGVAAGYRYGKLRLEGEIGYRENNIDQCIAYGKERSVSGYTSGSAFLINGYYDFVNKTAFTPYITAGIGMAELKNNDLIIAGRDIGSAEDTVLAYQVGAGVGYALNQKYTVDLKYRFSSATRPEFGGHKVDVAGHVIFLGLRYNF